MQNKWIRANYQPGIPLGKDGRRVTACAEHILLSKEAAKEGMVLLKNRTGIYGPAHTAQAAPALPLPQDTRIALFGKATIDYVKGGGGSGDVTVPYVTNLADGFIRLGWEDRIFRGTVDFYRENVLEQYRQGRVPGMTVEPEVPADLMEEACAFADTAIISISRFSGENWERLADFDDTPEHRNVDPAPIRMSREIFEHGDFYLSNAERRMVELVSSRFRRVILVLNTGGVMETARFEEDPAIHAILLAWQGGMEGGLAAAEVLTGVDSPGGRLADTFARDLLDYPSSETFFESDSCANYYEDIYVGYRYFETIPGAKEKVVYPFGYGLSYTEFYWEFPEVTAAGGWVTAKVTVHNTGEFPAKEVVQLYFSAPQGLLGKPARELGAYAKTSLLRPGESEEVVLSFPIRQMASYDDLGKVRKACWLLEPGTYRFYLGPDVRSAEETGEGYTIDETVIVQELKPRLVPSKLPRRLRADGSFEPLPMEEPQDWDASVLPVSAEALLESMPETRQVPRTPFRELYTKDFRPRDTQLADVADGTVPLEEFIRGMSDEDLMHLLGGQPNTGVANTYGFGNNARLGIPNIMTADGPAGLRIRPECGVTATAFPCATLLACTWNPVVCEAVGRAGALEVKENNIGVWLTPGVCIHRNPLCGRTFEYSSEDPYLTGKQAAALIRGIQEQGIAATPKHFAFNNKESNRRDSDSRVSERAAREIYLRQFEIIVKEAHPWSVMSAYNRINGCRTSESRDLLTGILREEWGFDGMVTTDWWNFGEHYKEVMAGNDLKMGCGYPERLEEAMKKGALTRAAMETAAARILGLILRVD
ncbi:MAG: glycoside hydrolase family 3 protein [Mogibacterium sp.]|nr:glycoside hydrolase family 3 protein [Mogibacterium sp.]